MLGRPRRRATPVRDGAAGRWSVCPAARSRTHRAWPVALFALLAGALVGCSSAATGSAATPSSATASAVSGSSASDASRARASAGCPAPAPSTPGARESHLPLRSLCALPPEAAQVWRTVESGGRLDYSRDGIVFNNAEHILPAHPRGYYHEYTVPTPGASDRAARRLVTGEDHELYYTGDHYASFVVVDPTALAPR